MEKKKADFNPVMVKEYLIVSFVVLTIWQVYLVTDIFRKAPLLKEMWSNLGVALTNRTEFYLSHYRWFAVLPIITIILAIDIIRRKEIPKFYSLIVFGSIGIITLILEIFYRETFLYPLFDVIQKVIG